MFLSFSQFGSSTIHGPLLTCNLKPLMVDSSEEPAPKRRRRGGLRQRLAADESSQVPTTSYLGESLLEKWAWGSMSPQEVQELAAKAVLDFKSAKATPPADLQFLAALGASGVHKSLGFFFLENDFSFKGKLLHQCQCHWHG